MSDTISKYYESEMSLVSDNKSKTPTNSVQKSTSYYSHQNNTIDDRIQINYKWQKRKNYQK